MGYPMTYPRLLTRNRLLGSYADCPAAGDLRRLERDQRDDEHLERYAAHAGVTREQAAAILEALFTNFGESAPWLGADPHGRA